MGFRGPTCATAATGSKKYLQLLLFQMALLETVFCGNVLVWPTEGSHWLNVKIVIQELIHHGHSVTVLVSNASLFIKPKAEATENFEVYNVPFKKDTVENLINDVVALWLNNKPTTLTFWQFYKELGKLSKNWHQMNRLMCDAVLKNQELMAHLQGSGYDLLLSDPVTLCGDLLALKLAIPFIYSLRFSPASTVERHCGKLPAPPSYTPAALSELTDCMTFPERIKNIVSYHLQDYVFQRYWGEWDIYYSKILVHNRHLVAGRTAHTITYQLWPPTMHALEEEMVVWFSTGFHNSYIGALPIGSKARHIRLTQPGGAAASGKGRPRAYYHMKQAMTGKDVAVLWLLAVLGWGSGEKVLVWPADNSHWLNMEYLLQELVNRGHEVTVLMPSCFLILDTTRPSPFQLEVVDVPITKKKMAALLEETFYFWFYEEKELHIWESIYKIAQLAQRMKNVTEIICDEILKNEALLERLRASNFDVFLVDPLTPGGELFAEKLGIPLVYTIRFSVGNTIERLCGALPTPPSYVPAVLSGLTDRMSFLERLKNIFAYTVQDIIYHYLLWGSWDQYYSDVLGRPTTLCETMGKAEIWLIRTYWDIEFPRPLLPNFEFVGGLHCQPAKPLPKEMEEFVQSSGEHGIVVFSLGSMVYNLSDEKSDMIARALSQIPQKVLWRYKGKKPENLGSNTRIYDWIPQNDLLGHPLAKAFITHGGTNGIYEAIYHGIPMVGIPMFADQFDNIAHMRAKGAAVQLDFSTLKTQDLVDALNRVIDNSTYKENALRLSKIHHDQPIKPLDRAVFWIEFVMRHKGAKHLRPAAHHLTWYQYHCLDVLAFLFTCTAIAVFILVKCCLFCCRRCGKVAKRKKE